MKHFRRRSPKLLTSLGVLKQVLATQPQQSSSDCWYGPYDEGWQVPVSA